VNYYSEVAETTREIAEQTSRAARDLTAAWYWFWWVPFRPLAARPRSSRERAAKVIRMRRLLQEAMGEGVEEDVSTLLKRLSVNRAELERAVVVWVELIEALVQEVEQHYGSAPNRGQLKAREVKAVMRYLLRAERVDVPVVPELLEPIVLDVFVGWTVDAVVLMANDYGLWVETSAPPRSRWILPRRWLASLYRRLQQLAVWLFGRLVRPLIPRPAVPRHLRSAVEAVEREGLILTPQELVRGTLDTLVWIGRHRRQVLAATKVIFESVQEAEEFQTLSGPEKKAYAYDLIFAVLRDMGFEERAGLVFAGIDSLVSGGIEAAVAVFNKRAWE